MIYIMYKYYALIVAIAYHNYVLHQVECLKIAFLLIF